MRASHLHRRSVLARVAHVAGAIALVTIAAAALIVGGALTLLRTSWGSDVARRIGLQFANKQLAGRLEAKRLRFGGDHLHLEDLALRDPRGGAVVARVRRLDVAFSPWALLRGRADLSRVAIVGPELHLVLDGDGSNLSRAVASRAPSPPEDTSPSRFQLSVGRLDLTGGLFDMRDRGAAAGAPLGHLRASNVGARIAGRLAVATWAFQGRVSVQARVEAPAALPLSLEANAKGDGDQRDGAVTISIGGGVVEATAETHRDRATRALAASARLLRLHLPQSLVRAVLPDVPLAAPLDVTANAAIVGKALRAEARVAAGGGAVALRGAVDFARASLRELRVDGHDVDLGRVLAGLPRSSLSFALRAHGAGRTLRTAKGEVSFTTPGGLLGGYSLGPVRLRAGASRGRVDLTELRAVLPGSTLTAAGWVREGAFDVRGSVQAADLGKTARSLGLAPLGLAGHGHLALRASGSIAQPVMAAQARFAALSIKGTSMRELALDASLRDQRMTVDLRMAAPQPLSMHVAGRVALARGAVNLDAFDLAYPEARWRLAAPARIVVGADLVLIDGLDLRADGQAIRADVQAARGAPIDARLDVSALDLGRLPRLARQPRYELGGRLDLKARVTGSRRKPSVEAHVSLASGRIGATRDLALALDLQASRARAAGSFTAKGLSTSARGRFDVPATWPWRDGRAPLELDLVLAPTDLAVVSKQLPLPGPPLTGQAGVSLQVTGTVGDPRARLEVTTRALVVSGVALGDPHLTFSAARGAPTKLRVDVQPGAAKAAGAPTLAGTLEVETASPLGPLLRQPRALEALLRTPFSARGDLGGVPLAPVARALALEAPVRGTASVRLTATGTPRAPTGALNVVVRGVTSDAFPPTDARLDLALGARDTRLAARVWRQGKSQLLASASATWGTPVARLLAGQAAFRAAASEAPLDVRLYAGPGELKHKTYVPVETGGPSDDLRVRARATATIKGTLSRPVVEANAEISEARLGSQNVGQARVQLRYAAAQASLTATASSAGGGTLRLQGSTKVDLGYPQGLEALVPRSLPLHASLEASAFDLGWLAGLHDAVRRVTGKLDASVRLDGSLEAPRFGGRVEWKNGTLAITGVGEYQDVHVALRVDQETISIDDLRASSRGGTGHVTGKATREPDGHFAVKARADLSRFPIYGQGDVLATLSTGLNLVADASLRGAKAHVEVEEVKAELGDLHRKDVQSLDRPANVVLVAGGRPINHEEARKLHALEEERRASAVARGDATAARPSVGDAEEPPPWDAEVVIAAPRKIWVKGEEADLELGLSSGFKVRASPELALEGSIIVRRGTVNVLGRRFTLQKDSTIDFHGPPEEPSLDVIAKHVNERSNVSVIVTLRGTPEDLKIDVSSPDRPDLNQNQLYSLLVTGQMDVGERAATGSSSFSNEAASLVGGLLASSIQKTLGKRLPLDVLTIQAGTGLTGSRVEAGTYLGDRLYVGYVGRVGSDPILLQNRNAVRIEYQFTPRWSLDAEYGDVGTGTADLMWNKHY